METIGFDLCEITESLSLTKQTCSEFLSSHLCLAPNEKAVQPFII